MRRALASFRTGVGARFAKIVKILALSCILVGMGAVPILRAEASVGSLASDPRVAQALDWLGKHLEWATEQQIRLTEIPAPTSEEAARARAVLALMREAGLRAALDSAGNVVAEWPGSQPEGVVLICAHLDTVFPRGTPVRVRRRNGLLLAPGIADNGAGLAALVSIARAVAQARLPTRLTLVFAADVGEEGEGNLRGIRQLVETFRGRLRAVIAIDGASPDFTAAKALASRRIEVVVTGPGGHSWADFGRPNPIDALARGIALWRETPLPTQPRSILSIGSIQGGTSVNSIPARAAIKVDIRSASEAEIDQIERAFRKAILAGVEAESKASAASGEHLEATFRVIGFRPDGELPAHAPLLGMIRQVDQYLGVPTRLERASTDANLPLSLGIPAVAVGGGGTGGGAHSLEEWYDPAGRDVGLKRLLLVTVATAGIAP
jgi:tripeptide aminopeptidase